MNFLRYTIYPILLILITQLSCNPSKEKANPISNYILLNRIKAKSIVSRTTNVPSRISLNIPSSLKKSGTAARTSLLAVKNRSQLQPLLNTVALPKADGYIAINSAIEKFSRLANEVAYEMLILDPLIPDLKFTPNVCIPGGSTSIKITDAMIGLVKESLQETGLSASEADVEIELLQEEGELPIAGFSIPSPAIMYKKLSGDFDHQLLYSFSSSLMVPKKCPTNGKFGKGLKFTSDFKKISFGHQENLRVGLDILIMKGNVTLETSSLGKKRLTFLNNFKIDTTNHTSLLILEECSKGDLNGNCVHMEQFYREDDSVVHTKDMSIDIKGRINNDGGLVEFTQRYTHSNITEEERELFNGSGILTGYEIKNSGNWVPHGTYPHLDINPDAISYDDHGFEFDFTTVAVSLSGCTEIVDYDVYVLALDGEDPDIDPTAMVGAGFQHGTQNIDYWGSESEVTTAKVWKYDHDKATYVKTASSCKVIKL